MESFFALLQKNVLDRRHWATRQELRLAIVTRIEKPTIDGAVRVPLPAYPDRV
jgi:nitric oxide synthase oxygenase domain/subunit